MDHVSRRGFLATAGSLAGASLLHTRPVPAQPHPAPPQTLSLAITEYLRFTPLGTGAVRGRGFDLDWVRAPRTEILARTLSDPAVHGGETSMLGHLLRLDAGDRSLVAIPIFLLRNFTARDLYTRTGSTLSPDNLAGRRLGIYNWAASGAVWYRHLLRYLGLDPKTIEWVVGYADRPGEVVARAPLPPHVTNAPADKSLTDLLLTGAIEAMFVPLPPAKYHTTDGPVVRLIPDYRALERRYFTETGCYPPQHVLVLREPVWREDTSMGERLLETFNECEAEFTAGQRLYPYSTPWLIGEVEETEQLMGREFHSHGLAANRKALDTFCQGAYDDGLTRRRITVDQYFAEYLAV